MSCMSEVYQKMKNLKMLIKTSLCSRITKLSFSLVCDDGGYRLTFFSGRQRWLLRILMLIYIW
ncbi:unnamed protein product [Arabidopsis halleri]